MHPKIRNHAEKKGSFFGVAFSIALFGVREFWRWAAAPPEWGFIQLLILATWGGPCPHYFSLCTSPRHVCFSAVQSLICVQLWATPWLQHTWPPCPSPTPGACSNSCPLSRWCHTTISSSVVLFFSYLNSYPNQGLFQWVSYLHQVARVLELQNIIQDWFPLGLTGLIFFQSKPSQKSSPTPQFKSINSSVLSFLYSPTLTSIHNYWKNHTFDFDLCQQINVSVF